MMIKLKNCGKKSKVGFGLKTNDWGLLWTTGSQQYL